MGKLSSIGFLRLVRCHDLNMLVETGTGHGHNVITALQAPEIREIVSIEVDGETAHRNRVTFSNEPRVRIYTGDSSQLLPEIARHVPADRRVLWFLDAHFPGSGRLVPLPMTVTSSIETAVPIVEEWAGLWANRDLGKDVVVVDDLCLFKPGDYQVDAPELRDTLKFYGSIIETISSLMSPTHLVETSTRDGGYLIATPRG